MKALLIFIFFISLSAAAHAGQLLDPDRDPGISCEHVIQVYRQAGRTKDIPAECKDEKATKKDEPKKDKWEIDWTLPAVPGINNNQQLQGGLK